MTPDCHELWYNTHLQLSRCVILNN
jgi:hypothetical protein